MLSRRSRKHIPVRKVGIAHQIVMQDPSTKEGPGHSNASLETDGLRMKVDKLKESRIENKQCHSNESTDTRTHPCLSYNVRNEPPSDLGSKSVRVIASLFTLGRLSFNVMSVGCSVLETFAWFIFNFVSYCFSLYLHTKEHHGFAFGKRV